MLVRFLLSIQLIFGGAALFAQSAPGDAEPVKKMAPDAHPVFEVVTIKPSGPTDRLRWWGVRGRHVFIERGRIADLLELAYSLHPKEIVGGPEWVETEKFDIDGIPNIEGTPNNRDALMMFQQLLTDRFKLAFHWEQRELAAYAITVAKDGPKLKEAAAAPNDFQDFLFRKPGMLVVVNETMLDFANGMQRAVMDKPVVDQTGLKARYNFNLNWTPDESQFIPLGWKINPPSADDPAAPPNLYTAIDEQLGLKMTPVKTMVRVLVIDHVEHPTAN